MLYSFSSHAEVFLNGSSLGAGVSHHFFLLHQVYCSVYKTVPVSSYSLLCVHRKAGHYPMFELPNTSQVFPFYWECPPPCPVLRRKVNANRYLAFSFFMQPETLRWHHLNFRLLPPTQLTQSGNSLTDTPRNLTPR